MIWKSTTGMQIEITAGAFKSITRYISSRKIGETGGILIGRYSDDLSTAVILSASGPGPQSVFGLFSFTRRATSLQKELDSEFELGRYYLGEWHCHPGRNHTPSLQDICQMQTISNLPSYNCPEPILMVLGRSNPHEFSSVSVIKNNRVIKFEKTDSEC